jgi:hypothetical protein
MEVIHFSRLHPTEGVPSSNPNQQNVNLLAISALLSSLLLFVSQGTYVRIYECMYVCMYVCMCVCVSVYE